MATEVSIDSGARAAGETEKLARFLRRDEVGVFQLDSAHESSMSE